MTKEYDRLFERMVAIGSSDIVNDVVSFIWRSSDGEHEMYEVPTISTIGIATYIKNDSYFYTAKVEKLRELAKQHPEIIRTFDGLPK